MWIIRGQNGFRNRHAAYPRGEDDDDDNNGIEIHSSIPVSIMLFNNHLS